MLDQGSKDGSGWIKLEIAELENLPPSKYSNKQTALLLFSINDDDFAVHHYRKEAAQRGWEQHCEQERQFTCCGFAWDAANSQQRPMLTHMTKK